MKTLRGGLAVLLLAACSPSHAAQVEQQAVRSYLEGHLTVSAEVDSVQDYRGFEVLVAFDNEGQVDTLGYAVTDSTGAFRLDVTAPARGIYPLVVSRNGAVLKVDELAVADGDSATVKATFPVGNRALRIQSRENGAWAAFRNTKAQHNNELIALIQSGTYDEDAVRSSVMRASTILWSMREAFPKTIGRDLASAEAVMLLGGWDDSLAVARAREIAPDNPGYANVARVARLAQARLLGPQAAVNLVRDFLDRAEDDVQRLRLQTELVLAYIDAGRHEEALAAARVIQDTRPGSAWAAWADRAIYELENLMPGMEAPAFTVQTREAETVSLDGLRGQVVVLEFYAPQNGIFQRDLDERKALAEAAAGKPFTLLSISLEPDSLLNAGFLEGREVPGLHAIVPDGLNGALPRRYNINVIPTRFLIDQKGKIVGKYVGSTLVELRRDALALLEGAG